MYNEQKLGISEYSEVFYDRLSTVVCNREYVEQNKDFYEQVIWKTFERYNNSKTESYSINQIVTIFEIILDSMLKFKPSNELPEDLINIV
jgi:hypothetical protein